MPSRYMCAVLLIILYTVVVRLIPVLITDMPFSNDVWPLIKITQALSNGTSIGALYEDPVYGYHAQWPFSALSAALYSNIVGVSPLIYYQYVGTCLVGLVLALLAYALGTRLFKGRLEYALFTLTLSMYPSFVVYTSAFLKEAYAHLIMLAFLVYILAPTARSVYFLIPVFATSLVLGHPLTSTILALVLALYYVDNRIQAFRSRKVLERIPLKSVVFAPILLVLVVAYNGVIAKKQLILLDLADIALLAVYAVSVYVAYVLLGSTGSSYLLGVLVAMTAAITMRVITSPLSYSLLLYTIPPLLVFFTSIVRSAQVSGGSNSHVVTVAPLLLVVSTGFLYITTYFTQVLGFLHRLLNYLVYAVAVLMANIARRSASKAAAVACALAVTTLISICAVSTGLDPLLFYWKYGEVDRELQVYIERFLTDVNISGDPKYSYFMVGVISPIPLDALTNTCKWLSYSRKLLLLSSDNLKYGIPISPVDFVRIRGNTFACGDLVFNAGDLWLFE